MRTVYRVLAWLVALGVVVQVAAVAFAHFGQDKWIDEGATLDKAVVESQMAGESGFNGVLGYAVHGINGTMVIPVVALLLLVVSFFAGIPRGVMSAVIVAALVAVQITLGFLSFSVPELGALHGVNALALFSVAVITARLGATSAAPVPVRDAPAGMA
jgi:hypothetical protein